MPENHPRLSLAVSTIDIDGKTQFGGVGGFISPSSISGKKVGESIDLSASDNTGFQFQMWVVDENIYSCF